MARSWILGTRWTDHTNTPAILPWPRQHMNTHKRTHTQHTRRRDRLLGQTDLGWGSRQATSKGRESQKACLDNFESAPGVSTPLRCLPVITAETKDSPRPLPQLSPLCAPSSREPWRWWCFKSPPPDSTREAPNPSETNAADPHLHPRDANESPPVELPHDLPDLGESLLP